MKESVLKQPTQAYTAKKNNDLHPNARRSLLREELATLTQNHEHAMVLNQLLYWTQRTKDFHRMLEEERKGSATKNDSPKYGWIYKTANDLIAETTLQVDRTTMRRYLRCLMEKEWIQTRTNPQSKWIRTKQYRVNVRQIQHDLATLDHHLSELSLWGLEDVFLREDESSKGQNARSKEHFAPSNEQTLQKVAEISNEHNTLSSGYISSSEVQSLTETAENSNGHFAPSNGHNAHSNGHIAPSEEQLPSETAENSNGRFAPSNGHFAHSNGYIAPSNEHNALSNGENAPSKEQNALSNTEITTKNTTEIINREHTQKTRAREDFDKNFFEEILGVWKTCTSQEVHLTEERKHRLQSVLGVHFQNDLNQWGQFCERVSHSPFLMGQGPRKWRVSLDWILLEENLLKVLEGNFDDLAGLDQKRAEVGQTSKQQEIHSVLASIADPVWKEWCSQLDFSIESRDPVSLGELKAIANARFLEVENDRLIWIGSQNPQVLSRIEDLKFKVLPVVQRTFPHAHTLRTRLCPDLIEASAGKHVETLPITPIPQKGENHAE